MRVRIDPELKAAKKGPVNPTAYANPNILALTQQLRSQVARPGVSGGPAKTPSDPKKSASAKRGWETRKGTRQSAADEARAARQAKLDTQHDEDRNRNIARQATADQQHAADRAQSAADKTQTAAERAAAKTQTAADRAAADKARADAKAKADQQAALATAMRRAAVPPKASTAGAPNIARFNAVGQIIASGEGSDADWADWAFEGAVAGVVDPKGVIDSLPAGAKAKYQTQLDALRKPDPKVLEQLGDKVKYGLATTNERGEYLAQQVALGKASTAALADAGYVGQVAMERLAWLTGQKSLEGKAGGADRNSGGAEQLRRYWTHGEGAAKIGWGTGGDFKRCVTHLRKYLGARTEGYCANRHHEATGQWPGRGRSHGKGLCCADCVQFKVSVADLRLDSDWREHEVKAGALFGGERTSLDTGSLRKRALRAWITRRGGPQALAPGRNRSGVRSGGPAPQRLSQGSQPGVLPHRQAALQARLASRQQDRLFDDMASGKKPDPWRPPPPPPMPDVATLAPGSGEQGGRDTPLTDEQWAARTSYYDRIIKTPEWRFGGPHDTSNKNFDARTQTWTPERQALHLEVLQGIIDKATAGGVGFDGHAVILGGMTGSGKSTVLHDPKIMDQMGVEFDADGNPASHMVVSSDDIKEALIARGAVDTMPGLTPFESSHLVHEESRLLGEALLRSAVAQRMNIIYDGTLGNYHLDRKRMSWLEDPSGGDPYAIQGLFVDVSPATGAAAVDDRWRSGVDRFEVDSEGEGGRPIPSYIVAQAAYVGSKAPKVPGPDGDLVDPKTPNRGVFQSLIEQGVFDTALVLDNDGANRGKNVVVQEFEHPDLYDQNEDQLVSA